jgi:hypothetical protein
LPSRLFSCVKNPCQIEIGSMRNEGEGNSHDEPVLSSLASQALLHPTGFPEESRGPMSCEGQPGFRSLGHEATGQFAEGVIIIGMLNPSTTDTTYTSLIQSGSFRMRGELVKRSRAHHHKSPYSRRPEASIPPPLRAVHPARHPWEGGERERGDRE